VSTAVDAGEARTFAVAISCIDGRVQPLLQASLSRRWGVDHVDVVTVPGPELAVPAASAQHPLWDAIAVSVERHGATQVAVVAHTDCAANPATDRLRRAQLDCAVGVVRARFPDLVVVGLVIETEHGRVVEPAATSHAGSST
jgi:hypothetical protein